MPITPRLHLAMFAFVALVSLLALLWGRRAARRGSVRTTSRAFGAAMVVFWTVYNLYYLHPGTFAWDLSLPLHACDILGLLAGVVLLVPVRMARAVLYFSGIGLASQAIITPTGDQDPTSYRFWLYWMLHAGIVASSLFDLFIRGYRPRARDLVSVLLVDAAYFLVLFPANVAFGWNYGYLGASTPAEATLLDLLGPWPLRAFVIMAAVVALQVAMFLAWKVYEKIEPTAEAGR